MNTRAPALLLALALSSATAEEVHFNSAGSLERGADRKLSLAGPIALSGELTLPPGVGRVPLVVLAHGCNGIGGAESGWSQVLLRWGYATFLLDSFTGRGLGEVCTTNSLTAPQRIPDAYGALRKLANHPRIDPARVVMMGFSHGAMLGLGASTAWARKTFAPGAQPAFRAFVLFYPWCNAEYPERERIYAPVRIHSGALDDWTPAQPCADAVKHWRSARQDAAITIYPGAHHSFDDLTLPVTRFDGAVNAAGCRLKLPSILGPTPAPEVMQNCLARGATIGGNADALKQAEQNVRRELAALLK